MLVYHKKKRFSVRFSKDRLKDGDARRSAHLFCIQPAGKFGILERIKNGLDAGRALPLIFRAWFVVEAVLVR